MLIIIICFFSNYTAYSVDWYKFYNEKWTNGINPSPTLAWSETYILRSYISMYRASKARNESIDEQNKWIKRIITHCDFIINSKSIGKEAQANLVYAGHGFTPLAIFVKLIFEDDKLYELYHTRANQYLSFLELSVIPFWKDFRFSTTPFNWYLSYGTMLIYLKQISENKYYSSPYYITNDIKLKEYYKGTVEEMSEKYFQDFGKWDYNGKGWNDSAYPLNSGLCYNQETNSYLWRYFDYTGALNVWGYKDKLEYQGIESDFQFKTDSWYKLKYEFRNDSLYFSVYDSSDSDKLFSTKSSWKLTNTKNDLVIAKRVDANEYFKGIIDECKLQNNGKLIAFWKMDGNAQDSSDNKLNGKISGSPELVKGVSGNALRFKNGDFITIPYNALMDSVNQIEMWIKFDELNTGRYYILGRGDHFHYGPGGLHIFMDCYKRPEDVGHANLDIEFLVNAVNDNDFKKYYSNEKIERFCNTFIKNIWSNSDSAKPAFRSHIEPKSDYGNIDEEVHTFRWLWLYQFNPLIGNLINNWYENHTNAQGLSEAIANLACWQAGVKVNDIKDISDIDISNNVQLSNIYNLSNSEYIIFRTDTKSQISDFRIYNSNGQILFNLSNCYLSNSNEIKVSTLHFSSGLYFYSILENTQIKTGCFHIVK